MNENDINRVIDEAAIRRLAIDYARAMDRNNTELLASLLANDATMTGPSFGEADHDSILGFPPLLTQMFALTQHVVHNHTIAVQADNATGEVYCTANHILPMSDEESEHRVLVWSTRYQDRYRRVDGQWRIAHRDLIVDWSETRPVELGAVN